MGTLCHHLQQDLSHVPTVLYVFTETRENGGEQIQTVRSDCILQTMHACVFISGRGTATALDVSYVHIPVFVHYRNQFSSGSVTGARGATALQWFTAGTWACQEQLRTSPCRRAKQAQRRAQ